MIKVKDYIKGYAIIKDGMPYICTIKPVKDDKLWHYYVTVQCDLSHLNSGSDDNGNLFYSSENTVLGVDVRDLTFKSDVDLILKVIKELTDKGLIMSKEEYEKETSRW